MSSRRWDSTITRQTFGSTSVTPSRAPAVRTKTAATSRPTRFGPTPRHSARTLISSIPATTTRPPAREAGYQTMISANVAGGVGQAIDTVNPANNWNTTSTFSNLLTESATFLQFRDDFQFVTAPMLNEPGMQLVPNSYTPFGNNGTTYHTTVASANNTGTGRFRAVAVHARLSGLRAHCPDDNDRSLAHRCRLQFCFRNSRASDACRRLQRQWHRRRRRLHRVARLFRPSRHGWHRG